MKTERGLCELYEADPQRADALIFGRRCGASRRGFLKGAGLAAMSAALAANIPYARLMPGGLIPAAWAETEEPFVIDGKNGLRILNDRPLNAETPAHLLDDAVTPAERFFVRNNGIPPQNTAPENWTITVDGEVDRPLQLSIADLRRDFEVIKLQLQLECGGNGRSAFNPPASGNQWTVGAIGNAEWTGVRLAEVLRKAGLKSGAVYTAHYGADSHLSGDPAKQAISRGMPVEKALDPYTLIVFEMNGSAIHPMNGAPVRILAPGWPGSVSQKWLTRIRLRDRIHDGAKMAAPSYSVPAYPPVPGAAVAAEDFRIIQSMPVKSLITHPRSGVRLDPGQRRVSVRGHAWSGDDIVTAMHVSPDFGASWTEAELDPPANRYAWQQWRADITLPGKGYYEIWARARNDKGDQQPFYVTWNPKGYLNNSMHRIAVFAA